MSPRSVAEAHRYVIALVLGLALVALGAASPSFAVAPASIAVYRTTTGEWFILDAVDGPRVEHWGCAGCGNHFPVPGDYDGDGTDEVAVAIVGPPADPTVFPNARFVPQTSAEGAVACTTCVLVPHDYDGDGKTDVAVYDGTTGQWDIRTPVPGGSARVRVRFGCPACGDVPVPGRFTDLTGSAPLLRSFPTGGGPTGITAGPDGNVWFTDFPGHRVGRLTPLGVLTTFDIPFTPSGITAGPDGNLWFAELSDRIGRITPAGIITHFPLPPDPSVPPGVVRGVPERITTGPDGNLWFTEREGDRIGRITPTGAITEFPLPRPGGTASVWPQGITTGPDGNLWFTEFAALRIGRLTPGGVLTEFPAGAAGRPFDITAAPDGNLWFTRFGAPRISRITPAGVIQDFDLITPFVPANPNMTAGGTASAITVGPDGKLWISGRFSNFLMFWRVDLSGQVEFELNAPLAPQLSPPIPDAITTGPDGRIWYANPYQGRVDSLSVTLPLAGIAVYRRTTGEWFFREPDATTRVVSWGCPSCGDVPVPRDYDGDGIDDIAVFRPSTAEWFIRRSSDGGLTHVVWGAASGDTPVPHDYDGDGKADVAIYRNATGEWFIRRSSDGGLTQVQWGCASCGDVPVPARY